MQQLLAEHWTSSPVERLECLQLELGRFTRTIDQLHLEVFIHEQNAAVAESHMVEVVAAN